jgi:hypothetical protein
VEKVNVRTAFERYQNEMFLIMNDEARHRLKCRNAVEFALLLTAGLLPVFISCGGAPEPKPNPTAMSEAARTSSVENDPIVERLLAYQGSYRISSTAFYDATRSEHMTGTADLWVEEDGSVYVTVSYLAPAYQYQGRIWNDLASGIRARFLNVTPSTILGVGRFSADGKLVLDFSPVNDHDGLRMEYTFVSPTALIMSAFESEEEGIFTLAEKEEWTRTSDVPRSTEIPGLKQ